jgi:metal-sulfur cluster biosynthetic enzyme
VTTVDAVREQLHKVVDPCSAATGSNLDIVEMGLVDTIDIDDGHADIQMRLTTPACHMIPYFVQEVEEQVGDLTGIESVKLETDNGLEWTEDMMSEGAKARREEVFARQAAKYEEELGRPDQADRGEGPGTNQHGES